MKKAIVAKKIGMTQVFNQETGEMIPVTVLEAGPCVVTQVKTVEHDSPPFPYSTTVWEKLQCQPYSFRYIS